MNYFEHHIGDYAEATAHLTFVEDAAYSRMIRKYYAQEKPLPADLKQVQRLIGARTREEKSATQSVLEEFFSLQDDGWHNERCDSELARFKDGEPEREVKKANEDNRLKRHRAERAELFKALTDAGQHAPWNIGMNELREMVKRLPETHLPPLPATAPATPATATQAPSTNTQSPELTSKPKPEAAAQASTEVGAAAQAWSPEESDPRLGQICKLLRGYGINTGPEAVRQHDWWKNPKATDDLIDTAIAKAKERKPMSIISVNYLRPIIDELLNPPPAPESKSKSDDWSWKKSDQGIERKARELGIRARPTESYRDLADRCEAEITKRKGAAKP